MYSVRKKGQMETLKTIVSVVIAFIAILLLIKFGADIYKITEPSQGSKVSFEKLTNSIDILVNSESDVCHLTISFDDNEALAGFNSNEIWVSREGVIYDDEISRPINECPVDQSCIVVCDVGTFVGDDNCQGSSLLDYKSFEDVSRFEYIVDTLDAVPFLYYGSDGTVEQFSLRKLGSDENYIIRIYNTERKIDLDSKPCESLLQGIENNISLIR